MRRSALSCLLPLFVLAMVLWVVPSASATTDFKGTSCTTATYCIGVGLSDDSGAAQARARIWNGTKWSDQTTPAPSGALRSELTAVACRSASECLAVGSYVGTGAVTSAFALRWDGTAWTSVEAPPRPAGASDFEFSAVSCPPPASANCIVVGTYKDAAGAKQAVATALSGVSWSPIASVPVPAGAVSSELRGISCESEMSCRAVGSYSGEAGLVRSLAVAGAPGSWGLDPTPVPSGGALTQLMGVSCAAGGCTAVGRYVDSGVTKTYSLGFGSGSWSLLTTPTPAGATASELDGVSCTAAASCTAVGSFERNSDTLPLALRWNGSSWAEQAIDTETFGALSAKLASVSCSTSTACHAVGTITYGHAATPRMLAYQFASTAWALTEAGGFQRTWSVLDLPSNSMADYGKGADVACPSTILCLRVGSVSEGETTTSRAKKWTGSAWSVMTVPTPVGAASSRLASVACATTTDCRAVGSYVDAEGATRGLAMGWNGTAWALTSVPAPAGAKSSQLTAVSCTSAASCRAVGSYVDSAGVTRAMALAWASGAWTVTAVPVPSGATASELRGITCSTAGTCTAVGSYNESQLRSSLIVRWDGTAWVSMPTTDPAGSKGTELVDVSCYQASLCLAVGTYVDAEGTTKPVAKKLATSWTNVALNALTKPLASFRGVSCLSTTACVVVGSSPRTGGGTERVAFALMGSFWLPTWTSTLPAGDSALESVSCPTGSFCLGVGSNDFEGLPTEEFSATAVGTGNWAAGEMPGGVGRFSAIDCDGPGSCMAVGASDRTGTLQQAAWRLGDDGWSRLTTPAGATEFNDVSCTTASQCTAVVKNLAQRWNGTEWVTQTVPTPAGGSEVEVKSVACTATNSCRAVGRYKEGSGNTGLLVAEWNGTAWSLQTAPGIAGATVQALAEISCASGSSCVAVGRYVDSGGVERPLIEAWNGTKWALQTAPVPAEATAASLSGVSCPSASSCQAIGENAVGSSLTVTYAVRWNGSSWAMQTTPNFYEDTGVNRLEDVSCASSVKCVAVGSVTGTASSSFLIGWDGTAWEVETAPAPPLAKETRLYGVACPNQADCVAAGWAKTDGRQFELSLKSVEGDQEPGQATLLEGGGATPSLSFGNEEAAKSALAADTAFQAAVKGTEYSVEVGPWIERTKEGAEVLVGAVAVVDLDTAKSWNEWWSWPTIDYGVGAYESGTYAAGVLPATATNVDTMVLNLDAEMDKAGNFLGGDVVQLAPEVAPGGGGELQVKPTVSENYNSEIQGY